MSETTRAEYRNISQASGPGSQPSRQGSTASGKFILSNQGIWLKKNWADATFNFCYRGSYSSLLPDYLALQSERFAFIDIGANQGLYSLIAAQSRFCDQALAFEPVQRTFTLLEDNIGANPNANKIRALRAAVSDRDGKQAISLKIGHSGAATLRELPFGVFRGTEMIETVGPEWLRKAKPEQREIVKIDVEGHEDVVLDSLVKAGYLDTATAVYYEVDTRWNDADQLKKILQRHGFGHFAQTRAGVHYDVLATRQKLGTL